MAPPKDIQTRMTTYTIREYGTTELEMDGSIPWPPAKSPVSDPGVRFQALFSLAVIKCFMVLYINSPTPGAPLFSRYCSTPNL